jgi:hypothetical protein
MQPEALEAALTTAGNKLVLLTRANTSPSSGQHDTDFAFCCLLLLPQHLNTDRHCSSRCLRGGTQTSQLNTTTKVVSANTHGKQCTTLVPSANLAARVSGIVIGPDHLDRCAAPTHMISSKRAVLAALQLRSASVRPDTTPIPAVPETTADEPLAAAACMPRRGRWYTLHTQEATFREH